MKRGRPRDPLTKYRVRKQCSGKYAYAVLQFYSGSDDTSVEKREVVRLGRVTEDNAFIPNENYLLMPPAERKKLIFPDGWDLREAKKLPSERGPGRPAYDDVDQARIYGATWFLTKLAEQLKVTKDLEAVFGGNREKGADVLSVAEFLITTSEPFSHMADWQELEWYPAIHPLTPKGITLLCKSIPDANRLAFSERRRGRLSKDDVFAVDTTTRGSCGTTLPDVAIGKNKQNQYEPQTKEVVVYSLMTHEPVYYKSLPGNVPDSRSLKTILKDLHKSGFTKIVMVTDRGFECQHNLDLCIQRHQPLISATSVERKEVLSRIRELVPEPRKEMEWIPGNDIYGKQFALDKTVQGKGKRSINADRLRLNLYFDFELLRSQMTRFENTRAEQRSRLEMAISQKTKFTDKDRRDCSYFRVICDETTQVVTSFSLNEKKIQKIVDQAGFFAITTLGVDFTAAETLKIYGLRDEQEKYYFSMKSRLDRRMQRNWSESAHRGARFIEFVALILVSWINHVWSTSETLQRTFRYQEAMYTAMRRIPLLEYTNKEKFIGPFTRQQILICNEFGITVPEDCLPKDAPQSAAPTKTSMPSKKPQP